jgi:hypothetical protein
MTLKETTDLLNRLDPGREERLAGAARRHHVNTQLKAIQDKHAAAIKAPMALLQEIAQDEAAGKAGLARKYQPAKVADLRADARRRINLAGSAQDEALQAFLAESKVRLRAAQVEAGTGQNPTERLASYMESDMLAKTIDPAVLLGQARERLALGDPLGAMVRLNAAKLGSRAKPLRGVDATTSDVEAALDKQVPARAEAVKAHGVERLAVVDSMIAAMQVSGQVASLAGDNASAAKSSVQAKSAAYARSLQTGEAYEGKAALAGSEG